VSHFGPGGEVAFHAYGSNHLWIYNDVTHTAVDTGLGLAAGSSPSIISWNEYLVAFEAAGTNHLGLYQSGGGGWTDTGVVMQAGSSPSITRRCFAAECHWDVAVQGSNHHLVNVSEKGGARELPYVLGENSSPSISGDHN